MKTGREADFEAWLKGVTAVSSRYPGHLGLDVIRPQDGDNEWVLIYRFDTVAHLKRWTESHDRVVWAEKADPLCTEGPHVQTFTGLEHWFQLPKRHNPGASPPARWKMAALTVLVIWPTANVVGAVLGPFLGGLHPWIRSLVTTLVLVPLMTWVLMPMVAKIFFRWLFPHARPAVSGARPPTEAPSTAQAEPDEPRRAAGGDPR